MALRTRLTRAPAPLRAGAAALAAVVLAEAAVWVFRPRGEIIDPAHVDAGKYFDPAELARIADFHDPQRLLGLGSLGVEIAVLTALALWRPAPIRRVLRWPLGRPILGGAAVGGAISLTLAVTALPLSIWGHQRAHDVGLSTQALGPWFVDVGKAAAVGVLMAAAGGAAAVFLIRRLGRRFWIGGTVLVIGFAIVSTWLAPVVLAPLFNDFKPLPSGPARRQVLELGRKAGVDIGHVYEVDASRQSSSLNAYVNGVGSSKRVVIYDNALSDLDRAELRSLVAHELGHVRGDDIWRGIGFAAVIAPLGVLFVQLFAFGLAERRGDDPASPAVLPALALAVTLATLVLNVPGNQLSRMVEARADSFALEVTHDPGALIALQRKLTISNFGDPDPPSFLQFAFGTHPTTLQRIGAAVTYERRHPLGGR